MTAKREIAERKGREGEAEAARWLAQQGWEVLAERRKTKLGEIDLIARKPGSENGPENGIVAFIEVKWRKRAADLATAIDERRLARVAAAVEVVAHEYAKEGEDLRIDVILLAPGSRPRHIENAWMP
ncbi:YraN family protein [uncultured Erythrobacter sp.]|uniref:YraN family protein n=1 Tax=uncultured Erythrobacter sp. TaxID=263913 RepID=UPI002610F640|nr:YraN family protein [uncultured Erythrobacter sp.]